jgi:hypothetical protein
MSNTTFSLMSYPHLDITISAYKTLRSRLDIKLKQFLVSSDEDDETLQIRARISILDELIDQASVVRGCVDQHLNG